MKDFAKSSQKNRENIFSSEKLCSHKLCSSSTVVVESISAINTFIAVFANVNVIARCTVGTITVKQTTQSLIGW